MSDISTDVLIVGAGPTGLAAALAFAQRGISCVVCEQQAPHSHSRSIGIHPPSLRFFEALGLTDVLLAEATRISKGTCIVQHKEIGTLDFAQLSGNYRFIATLAQHRTEAILRENVLHHPQINYLASTMLTHYDGASAALTSAEGHIRVHAKHIIGCDGKDSTVRTKAGITAHSHRYPDVYIMGDDAECTLASDHALVYLHQHGLVESFPHSSRMRRWVVKTSEFIPNPTKEMLSSLVFERTGHRISPDAITMLSSFGTQRMLAEQFATASVWLAGDAAHVVSPIGGQGMNLGWLSLPDLVEHVIQALYHPTKREYIQARYSRRRRMAARQAIYRAEMNMRLGRAHANSIGRMLLTDIMLNTPASALFSRIFSMHYL